MKPRMRAEDTDLLHDFICVYLWLIILFQKISPNSEQANEQPKKFYDESGKVKTINKRN